MLRIYRSRAGEKHFRSADPYSSKNEKLFSRKRGIRMNAKKFSEGAAEKSTALFHAYGQKSGITVMTSKYPFMALTELCPYLCRYIQ